MNWKTSKFVSSVMGLMRVGGDSVTGSLAEGRLEAIRQFMMDCLKDVAFGNELRHVRSRVLYGSDIQTLWYVRSDIMNLLSSTHGEAYAHAQLALITEMFRGLLPAGLDTRPAALRR
jgi:hypothetical protein